MKKLLLILLLLVAINALAGNLPNAQITPGAIDATVINSVPFETLCTPGFTGGYYDTTNNWHHAPAKGIKPPSDWKPVRNVTAKEKLETYHAYGMKGNDRSVCKQGNEIDHDCSLELACSNVAKNRWPQSYCGPWNAKDKDRLENKLHALVCNKKMTLSDAQQCISVDWIACYKKIIPAKASSNN